MWDVLLDAVLDCLKLVPFLFLAYLLIEYLEHRSNGKLEKWLAGSGRLGTVIGALLGCVPQCGFSVAAANLYAERVISMGTVVAVFLATSDEAIPVLLANPGHAGDILMLIAAKLVIAVLFGLLIDFVFSRRRAELHGEAVHTETEHLCEHCGCGQKGIVLPALKHTGSILLFIFIITLALNAVIYFIGEENLGSVLLQNSLFQPLLAAVIGLIPNCASSVLITELYIAGSISFGSAIAGLCSGAGLGLVVLFRMNRSKKENFEILGWVFAIACVSGVVLQLLGV